MQPREHIAADDIAGSRDELQIGIRHADPDIGAVGASHTADADSQPRDNGDAPVVPELYVVERLKHTGRSRRRGPGQSDGRCRGPVTAKDPVRARAAGQSRTKGNLALIIKSDLACERIRVSIVAAFR